MRHLKTRFLHKIPHLLQSVLAFAIDMVMRQYPMRSAGTPGVPIISGRLGGAGAPTRVDCGKHLHNAFKSASFCHDIGVARNSFHARNAIAVQIVLGSVPSQAIQWPVVPTCFAKE
jgi:hypothetical protein